MGSWWCDQSHFLVIVISGTAHEGSGWRGWGGFQLTQMCQLEKVQVSGTGHLGSVARSANFPLPDHLRHALHIMFVSGGIASRTPRRA